MNHNPLKQYFRRPSIYIKLPSGGKYYDQTVIDMPEDGEIAVYPMTAVDEMTSRTPDALFNGHAVADIVKSCIPCIKDPWKINNVDLDALLMAIRVASNGEVMDVSSVCPKCQTEGTYGLNLVNLISEQKNIDYDRPLRIRELEIRFRPLTYSETNKNNLAQYEIQKMLVALNELTDEAEKQRLSSEAISRLNVLLNEAFASTIASITTPETVVTDPEYIKEFLYECDRQTNNAIRDEGMKLREMNRLKPFNIQCSNCQNTYEQEIVLNISDFFV